MSHGRQCYIYICKLYLRHVRELHSGLYCGQPYTRKLYVQILLPTLMFHLTSHGYFLFANCRMIGQVERQEKLDIQNFEQHQYTQSEVLCLLAC